MTVIVTSEQLMRYKIKSESLASWIAVAHSSCSNLVQGATSVCHGKIPRACKVTESLRKKIPKRPGLALLLFRFWELGLDRSHTQMYACTHTERDLYISICICVLTYMHVCLPTYGHTNVPTFAYNVHACMLTCLHADISTQIHSDIPTTLNVCPPPTCIPRYLDTNIPTDAISVRGCALCVSRRFSTLFHQNL